MPAYARSVIGPKAITRGLLLWAIALPCAVGAQDAATTPQPAMAAWSQGLIQRVAGLQDYQLLLTKQQFLRGKLRAMDTVLLKHRRTPECRYMKWLEGPHEGREALHCVGRNKDRLKVHEGGFLGLVTLDLDPAGSTAQRNDLRQVTESGVYNLAQSVQRNAELAMAEGTVAPVPVAQTVHGNPAHCVTTDSGVDSSPHYTVGNREICLYADNGLPAQVRLWRDDGQLMEHYTFREYVLNPGFTEADFDPENDDYDF